MGIMYGAMLAYLVPVMYDAWPPCLRTLS